MLLQNQPQNRLEELSRTKSIKNYSLIIINIKNNFIMIPAEWSWLKGMVWNYSTTHQRYFNTRLLAKACIQVQVSLKAELFKFISTVAVSFYLNPHMEGHLPPTQASKDLKAQLSMPLSIIFCSSVLRGIGSPPMTAGFISLIGLLSPIRWSKIILYWSVGPPMAGSAEAAAFPVPVEAAMFVIDSALT